jgi:SynChlorMet cassette radical SAM/SPASM protein ScmF
MQVENEKRKYALRTIYFYISEGCNLRCRHCWILPKYQDGKRVYPSLEFDLFKSIVDQAKRMGLRSVKLTGGEPLLHPRIRDILEVVRSEGVRLMVETNGILCTEEIAQQIASSNRPFVSISLDGADGETHDWMRGVPGCFDQAVEGIRNLVKAGLRPQAIMSLVRANKAQIESVVRLAESLGCGSVKFNIVQPSFRGEQMQKRGETLSLEEHIELGQWVERDLCSKTSLRLYYSHPLAFRPLGRMFSDDGCGCATCAVLSIIGVLADGSYALCGIGETIPELVFGHADRDRLEDVWANAPVILELREGMPKRLRGVCAECAVRGVCIGYCVAQNYYASGSLWEPYWYCDAARRKGLFPEPRIIPSRGVSNATMVTPELSHG